MRETSSLELYRDFLDFVRSDLQSERRLGIRRMFNVFLWCFVLPAGVSILWMVLIKTGLLPRWTGRYLDWVIVGFPLAFVLYILIIDLLHDMPEAFRRGGMSATLGRTLDNAKWRDRVCEEMRERFLAKHSENWPWLIRTFEVDLKNIQYRTRYLTALAGAVFFLLLQGLDYLDEPAAPVAWTRASILSWFETSSSHFVQFTGLGLFLVLLYLSGNQTYHSLMRYLQCAELLGIERNNLA